MGIYVKSMEMPKNCCDCVFSDIVPGEVWCKQALEIVPADQAIDITKHPDCCPLVSVPPHGGLIDRNKLYEKTAEWEAQALHMVEVTMCDEDTTEWKRWSAVLTERSAFKFDVADAPTIIPASEEG